MTKRISKLRLPHPMPVQFAHELAELVLGNHAPHRLQVYATAQILMVSWTSFAPLTLIELFRGMSPPAPLHVAGFLDHAQRSDGDSMLFEEVVACLNAAERTLADEEASPSLAQLEQEVMVLWHEMLRRIGASAESARALRTLVSKYTGEAVAPDDEPDDDAAVAAMGQHILVLGGGRHLMGGDPGQMIAQMMSLVSGAGQKPAAAAPARVAPAVDASKPSVVVYERAAAVSVVQRLPQSAHPLEGNAQQRNLLTFMADNDGVRQLVEVPDGDPLAQMHRKFPHFSEVLDLVRRSLALAGCGADGKPVSMPPILLRGEPGTGKTFFAQELARVLKLHFVERDLSVTSDAFVISGMDSGWKNSKPGIVFEALVNGTSANPLILLNEVDKASTTGSHNSPLAPMYALLEPTSASRFSDEFIPVSLDASRVNWILTANNGEIPAPVLSRLEVFDIRLPTQDECRMIAGSVWESLCERGMPKGHGFSAALGEPMLDYMSRCSPRVMRKMLALAAGNAVLDGRKHLLLDDLEQSKRRYVPPARTMGFAPT
jgi:ATP-dependent Lon protease